MENAVIVLENLPKSEVRSLQSIGNTCFYTVSEELRAANQLPFETDLSTLGSNEKRKLNKVILDKIQQFPEINIDGRSVIDIFSDGNFRAWYYHRFRIYFDVRNAFYHIHAIENTLAHHQECIVYTSNRLISSYFEANSRVEIRSISKGKAESAINYKEIMRFFGASLGQSLKRSVRSKSFLEKDHLLLTVDYQYPLTKPNQRDNNIYFGRVIQDKRIKNYSILNVSLLPKLKKGAEIVPEINPVKRKPQKNEYQGEALFLEMTLLSLKNLRAAKRFSKQMKKSYETVDIQDDSISRLFLLRLKQLHSTTISYYLLFLGYLKMFQKSSFKSVIAIDENGPAMKLVIDAARKYQIKSIGVQHGTIHELHPNYIFGPADCKHNPHTDFLLLWGKYYFDLLTKESCYQDKNLAIIGQLRMDDVLAKDRVYLTLPDSIIKPTDKKVVFASQPQRDESLRKRAAVDFLTSMKNLHNLQAIIKIHPRESRDYYEKIAREMDVDAIIVGKEVDLFELILCSDIMITCFSTVGSEAVCMRKPLIVIDHLEQDVMGYIQNGVALKSTDAESLERHIKDLTNGVSSIDKKKVDAFIESYAHKVDGQASERFFEFMKELEARG